MAGGYYMKNIFTTFFTCCFLFLSICGSTQNFDSLKMLLSEAVDKGSEAKLHQDIAAYCIEQEKFKLAEFHLLEARGIYSNDTSTLNYAMTLLSCSGVFIKQKLFNKAYRFASDAALIAENNDYKKIRALAIYNISIIFKETGRNAEAASFAKQAILLFTQLNDSLLIAYAYNNMGMIAKNLAEWEEARAYYDTSLILKKKFGKPIDVLSTLGNIAVLYKQLGLYDSAYRLFQKVKVLAKESGSAFILAGNFLNTAEMMALKGDTSTALSYFDTCLNISKDNNFIEMQREVYGDIAELNYALRNYKKAWDYKGLFLALSDSILKSDIALTTEQLQVIQQNHYNQSRIDKLELKNTNNKLLFHFAIISLLIVILIHVYLRSFKTKKAKEALKISEQKFRTLAENSAEVIWSSDLSLQLTYISPSTEKLLGYKPEERIMKSMVELFSSESVKKMKQELKRNIELSKNGKKEIKPFNVELKGKRKNGQEVWVELNADFVFDEHNQPSGLQGTARDITDRKKAESALAESERKFEELFNDIPDAVFITGIGEQSGKIIDVNPAAEKQTGYARDELLQINLLSEISVMVDNNLTSDRENNLINNDKIKLTEQKRKKDGGYIWTEVVVQKIVIDGKPFALSVSRDITERVNIQKNLKDSEARLRSVLNALPDILFVFDKDGHFLEYHTDTHEKLIFSPEAFLNKKVDDVLPPELAKLTMMRIREIFKTGKIQLYEYSIDMPDGKNYFDVRMVKATDDTALTIVRNVTETRNAEQDRKQNEVKFKTLFLNTPLGVFNFDENSIILSCNEKFEKIIGSGFDILSGFNILAQAKDVELKNALSEAIAGGSGYYEGNYKSVTAGKVTPIKAFFKSIYNEHGKFVDGIGIVEDVTGQKKHEAKLIEALKRAEQSDKLKSSFMATMSHELRTPLNTVIGFADIIEESMPIDQILEFSGVIAKSGRHLLSIIEDVLDISLIDSGESKLVHERFFLAELFNSLYNTATRNKITLNKDHLNIIMNLETSIRDVKLSGDISKLSKVFSHLIKNALKFTREGKIEIGAYKKNNGNNSVGIVFYVKDSGIGIPADKHDIIFELFRQVDDSSTREFEGTGLGLSISKRLIHLMGGEIWLESESGKGSTFYFQLPLLPGTSKAGSVQHKYNKPELRNTKNINVLVAEDDDTNFHLFRLLLTRKNMNVIRARNGKEALEILSSGNEVNLVLMDINMPVLNGYDATKKIKELYKDIPVIAVTAYAMSGDKTRAEEAGCDDYITKPINNIIFYETIAKYVSS